MTSMGLKVDYHKRTKSDKIMSECWNKQLQAPPTIPRHRRKAPTARPKFVKALKNKDL